MVLRGCSSVVSSGSWFAISTIELASGVTVGPGLGVIISTLSSLDSSVVGLISRSASLDNHGIAVNTSAGAGLA